MTHIPSQLNEAKKEPVEQLAHRLVNLTYCKLPTRQLVAYVEWLLKRWYLLGQILCKAYHDQVRTMRNQAQIIHMTVFTYLPLLIKCN